MLHGVAALDVELGRVFEQHPQAALLRSAPGLGPVLAARVLTEIGDDPTRFATVANLRSFAGTAPVTRAFRESPLGPRPATSGTNDSPTPATGGRSPRSPAHRRREPTTTTDMPPATGITPPYATSRTSSSETHD